MRAGVRKKKRWAYRAAKIEVLPGLSRDIRMRFVGSLSSSESAEGLKGDFKKTT